VAVFERSIDALGAKAVAREELADRDTERLRAIIEKKKRAGEDLVQSKEEVKPPEPDEDDDVDLLDTIRQSLQHTGDGHVPGRGRVAPSSDGSPSMTKSTRLASGKKKDLPVPKAAAAAKRRSKSRITRHESR
jgi:hypothetical protein